MTTAEEIAKRIWFSIAYPVIVVTWVWIGIWTGEADEDPWNPLDNDVDWRV